MNKRLLGWVLALVMAFGTVIPHNVVYGVQDIGQAQTEAEPSGEVESEVSAEGTNSFGNLLADSLEQEAEEQQENNGCNIFAVEMDGNMAMVSFETVEDCTLVVGIYEEDGIKMLGSGSVEVSVGETEAVVDIETENMPQYFYLRGFLVETDTLRPLADSYESPMYTQEMQEFLAKTTEDFDADKVLNLDEDTTNNFAVYSDDTIQITQSAGKNEVVTADEDNNRYVIENADKSVTSLKNGDIFACEYGENEVLIVKVEAIEVDGTTVTITGADTSMEEVFEFVKIEGEASTADAEVDASNLEEGVVYEGLVESADEEDEIQPYAWEGSGSQSYVMQYKFLNKNLMGNVKLSGGLEFKIGSSVKYYISLTYQYLELGIDYSAKLNISLSGKADMLDIPLAYVAISPIPGVYIEFTPSFVVGVSAKLDFSGKLAGKIGFSVSSDEGMHNLTSNPSLKGEVKGEVTLFAGLSLKPKVKILSDKIAKVGLSVTVGGEVKGTMGIYQAPSSSVIHSCEHCIDGTISAKANLKFEASLLNSDKLSFVHEVGWEVKLCDFYYSVDKHTFGFTTCPYYKYKTQITVVDKNGKEIAGAVIKAPFSVNGNDSNAPVTNASEFIEADSITTGDDGKALGYLSAGNFTLEVSADGYQAAKKKITVVDGAKKVTVKLASEGEGSVGADSSVRPVAPYVPAKVQMVSLGVWHSGAVTEDGSLYMWGDNDDGQLGNGTREDSKVPIKVLDNVASVSLGWSDSGAVTKDGSLYMWGNDDWRQIGNGTMEYSFVPIKVLDDVVSVSLGGCHSGAVTKDGSLYMCGGNDSGEIGNGTTEYSLVPVKVLDNVASVSLAGRYSGAVTKDGSLYMWGERDWGNLRETTEDSSVPVKVLDNVVSVSLGTSMAGAITKDGSLYTWGSNYHGQLGNGTTEDSHVPIKINIPLEMASPVSTAATLQSCLSGQDIRRHANTFSAKQTPIAALSDATAQTACFRNLMPNGTYNFYAVKSLTVQNSLSADNLLCMSQAVADSAGELEVPYKLREEYENAIVFIVGATRHDISDAEISVSNFIYTGEEQFVAPHVVYDGTALSEGEDYELSGDYSAARPGTYTVTITGIGNYTGEVTVTYQVIEYFFTTKGDVTGDSRVRLEDVQMVLRTVLRISNLTDEQKKAADVNEDGKIDLNDAYKILQAALGAATL